MKNTILSGRPPKRGLFIEVIASLLLLFFVHTVISTFIQLQSLKNMLAFYTRNTATIAWLIVLADLITAVLIFLPRTRLVGFIAAMLMAAFAGITILRHPHFPHDFGGIFSQITRSQKWYLITAIGILSCAGIIISLVRNKQPQMESNENHVVFT